MLASLSIKNFALIEALEIKFSDNFSIITGETGAGKSILLGAIGLVLGNRADLNSLKEKNEKCIIEADFFIEKYNLKSLFSKHDIDYESHTIIRREILPSGKSRAFINDSPVTLNVLQELANYLIDIHSQHQTLNLLREDYQVEILDGFANNTKNVTAFQEQYTTLKSLQKQYDNLLDEQSELEKEQEYNNHLLQELLVAQLKDGEQEELEQRLEQLSNVALINENIDKAIAIANDEQIGVTLLLNEFKTSLQRIANFSQSYDTLYQRVSSLLIEFQDVIDECVLESENIINDPEQLTLVSNKLQVIYELQKKHQVTTVASLLEVQENLDKKVSKVEGLSTKIRELQQEIKVQTKQVEALATIISAIRVEAAPKMANKIEEILVPLGMPDARVAFKITTLASFNTSGKNEVQLYFSANKGITPEPIKKVASGGEMSRITLAIKSIRAAYTKMPTVIFDEIDTGVSGEIALKMGEIMRKMSKSMQVLAITHLPQIAAKGDQHYKVFKNNQGNSTVSEIKLLENSDRVVEIAEMLSGKNISDSALNHAKNLLN